ncbi:MAG: type II toxin-antitoxin system VapC family toxin [Dehalococcoidales bacterium]|nr:type II toxin-antitoxin system VapC family toxin [Dehalococcoidales bacterium]
MAEAVIDASALLALLNSEPGADIVAEALPGAVISAVNLSEVVAKLSETGMPEKAIRQALQPLGLEVIPFDDEQAYQAGILRAATQDTGVSLGDRSCLSLAKMLGVVALTADKAWARLSIGATIRVIR